MQITATTLSGLENTLAAEIQKIGGENITILRRAVTFEGNTKLVYRALYELRTALRIFLPFYSFKTKHENHLYGKIRDFDWTQKIQLKDTFVIHAFTASKYLTHSKYLALKIKDAISDQFRSKYDGLRPSIDRHNPIHRLNVHLGRDNLCTLSWDVSGDPLNRRGYRLQSGKAPLNEVLAAGIILQTNWDKASDFIDPMCGSGTFLIEAAMIAANIPPQINRKQFGIMKNADFDPALWLRVQEEAQEKISDFPHQIIGYDKDPSAVNIARSNVQNAGLDARISVNKKDFHKVIPTNSNGLLLMNPPYDERLKTSDILDFYKDIGHSLKHNFSGFDAWIFSGNIRAMRQLGLRPSSKKILFNGAIECQLAHYELYKGSKNSGS